MKRKMVLLEFFKFAGKADDIVETASILLRDQILSKFFFT